MSKYDALYEYKKKEDYNKLLSLMSYYFNDNNISNDDIDVYVTIFLKSFFRLLETEEEVVVSDLGTFKKVKTDKEYKLTFKASTIAKNVINNCGKYYNNSYEKIIPKERLTTVKDYERYIDLQLKKRELDKNKEKLKQLEYIN